MFWHYPLNVFAAHSSSQTPPSLFGQRWFRCKPAHQNLPQHLWSEACSEVSSFHLFYVLLCDSVLTVCVLCFRSVYLHNNKLTDAGLPENMFNGSDNLEILIMSSNFLRYVPKALPTALYRLHLKVRPLRSSLNEEFTQKQMFSHRLLALRLF